MKRRSLMIFTLSNAFGWPCATRAQQASPVVGFFHEGSPLGSAHAAAAFREGLSEAGFVDGKNVRIEYRWADGQYDRLPGMVEDLVLQKVAVIAGGGGPRSASAAKEATATIPIVFTIGVDPIAHGLVTSLNHPGGNVTGVTMFATELTTKRLEKLRELIPQLRQVALLVNPNNPNAEPQMREVKHTVASLGLQMHVVRVGAERDFDAAFTSLVKKRADGLIVSADPFLSSRRDRIVALSRRHSLPTIYPWRDYVESGGLMSYGTSNADAYRQTGIYAGRILKGAKAGDLPVLQPKTFELVLNRKTLKAMHLKIPPTFAWAEVIE